MRENVSAEWSQKGGQVIQPGHPSNLVECIFDHATPFTVLMDLCASISNISNFYKLKRLEAMEPIIVTTACLVFSILCCVTTLLVYW